MSDKPEQHKTIERRLMSVIARIQVDQCLSPIGKSQMKAAIASGVKGPALAEAARGAHRSGWVPSQHRFTLDSFGCIRKVELRFNKTEEGVVRTISRMITAQPDGRITEAE